MANMLGDAIHRRRRGTMDWITGLQLDLQFTNLAKLFQDSAGTVPVTTVGQPIGRALDSSPNNNHFSQATGARQPTYQADGALFDGIDDVLSGLSTNLNAVSRTILIGWTPTSSPAAVAAYFGNGAANYHLGHSVGVGSTRISWANSGATQKTLAIGGAFSVGVYARTVTRWDVSGSNVDVTQRVNGSLLNFSNYTDGHAVPAGANFYVGALGATGANGINGRIKRLLVYNRALSDAEIAEIGALI